LAKVKFQLDEHMAHAIARELRNLGIDIVTTTDAGLRGTQDTVQLAHANATGRVIVTEDSDFLGFHGEGREHAGIAYCQQGSRSIGEIITGLLLIYETYEAEEMVRCVEYM
jgi:predicted nuclease of predicted toxin-antitoxin system